MLMMVFTGGWTRPFTRRIPDWVVQPIGEDRIQIPPPPWWNEESNKISHIRLAKFKKYRAIFSYENYLDFEKFDAHTTKRLKQIKSANFKSFCESLSSKSSISEVWAKIRGFRHRLLSPPSSTSTLANLETLEHMNEYIRSFLTMAGDTGGVEIPPLPEDFLSSDIYEENRQISTNTPGKVAYLGHIIDDNS